MSITVSIVEDNDKFRGTLARVLNRAEGFRCVSEYPSAEDALKALPQDRPDVVLTGHVHQSPFRQGGSWVDRVGDTWVFNSGREMGPVPCHIVIEPAERRASWFSTAGPELVDLTDTSARRVALE